MNIPEILTEIRSSWIHRVSNSLARGAGVRENFQEQLETRRNCRMSGFQLVFPEYSLAGSF